MRMGISVGMGMIMAVFRMFVSLSFDSYFSLTTTTDVAHGNLTPGLDWARVRRTIRIRQAIKLSNLAFAHAVDVG
jgi:hypothetical protein